MGTCVLPKMGWEGGEDMKGGVDRVGGGGEGRRTERAKNLRERKRDERITIGSYIMTRR